jgi:diacylglycerol kinase family enzyme
VIANGQFLRGVDLVPRGHPGDGRLEVQIYTLRRGERRAMRRRLATGRHVPHTRIRTRAARTVAVRTPRPVPLEVDGEGQPAVRELRAEVVPGAFRLLV